MNENLTCTVSHQPLAHVSQSLATSKQELNQTTGLKTSCSYAWQCCRFKLYTK